MIVDDIRFRCGACGEIMRRWTCTKTETDPHYKGCDPTRPHFHATCECTPEFEICHYAHIRAARQ